MFKFTCSPRKGFLLGLLTGLLIYFGLLELLYYTKPAIKPSYLFIYPTSVLGIALVVRFLFR